VSRLNIFAIALRFSKPVYRARHLICEHALIRRARSCKRRKSCANATRAEGHLGTRGRTPDPLPPCAAAQQHCRARLRG
jgi:hypothetical protein